jgi:hypothetical protein
VQSALPHSCRSQIMHDCATAEIGKEARASSVTASVPQSHCHSADSRNLLTCQHKDLVLVLRGGCNQCSIINLTRLVRVVLGCSPLSLRLRNSDKAKIITFTFTQLRRIQSLRPRSLPVAFEYLLRPSRYSTTVAIHFSDQSHRLALILLKL